MRIRVLRYGPSSGGRELASELGGKLLRLEGSKYKARRGDVVVNWGSGKDLPASQFQLARIINKPGAVRCASDKARAFALMHPMGVPTVPWTRRLETALWWAREGHTVVSRATVRGHSGEGIFVCKPGDPVVAAPLYTKYVKKTHEFRVHCNTNGMVYVQQKRRRRETPDDEVNWQVRNHDNGFIYCTNNVRFPSDDAREDILDAAHLAIESLDLHYGAVDIGWHKHTGASVYEVNTAPGIDSDSTRHHVARLIRGIINDE